MKTIPMESLDIVGFDFGHGETAVARVSSLARDSEPELLEILARKSQITALAFKPGTGDLVGDQALKSTGITELHIGFKPLRISLGSPDRQDIIRRYIRKYLNLLEETGQVTASEHPLFVVGAPSGWSDSDRAVYADILKAAGMHRVSVEKESRAAFLQFKESASSDVDADRLMQQVLIIDIGSSTTDFTFVRRLEVCPADDFGWNLGAGLIEEKIFERTLDRMGEESPSDLRRLSDAFRRFPHFQRQCLIACREGKEKYFAIPDLYDSKEHAVDCSIKFRTLQPPIEFEPCIYRDEMESILTRPMEALNGKSWKDAFHEALMAAKNRMGTPGPDLVVLTGGASRMQLIHTLCSRVFASGTKIVRGPEPEFTIARGLARIGRTNILAAGLKQAIEEIGRSPEITALVQQHIPALIDTLAEPVADALISHTVSPALSAWREGRLRTLNDIRPEIEALQKNLPDRFQEDVALKILDDWLNDRLLPALADFTDPICRQFDIPRSVLDLRKRNIAAGIHSIADLPFQVKELIRKDEVLVLTSVLAGIIVGMVSGGTGLALFHLPLAGQAIAAVVGAVAAGYGMDAVTEKIKIGHLPEFARKWLLPDAKLEQILTEQRLKFRKTLMVKMTAEAGWKQQLAEDVLKALKQVLDEQVEKAVMWIR